MKNYILASYNAYQITTSAKFRTTPKPMEPLMTLAGQALTSSEVEVRSDEDLVLGCVNKADRTGSTDNTVCTWTCKVR